MSEVKANKISPATSTVVTLGDSSDTFVVTTGAKIDINGTELILDADADTSITADTDDQIDIKVGGTDVVTLTNSSLVLKGTTPTITIGDAGAEDTKIVFDGNAQDYHIGLDDTADSLVLGLGSALGTTTHMAFDAAGIIRKPLQSSFRAYASGGTTLTNNTAIKIGMQAETYDTNADYDTVNSRFTAPVDGRYLFCVNFHGVDGFGTTDNAHIFMDLYLNGASNSFIHRMKLDSDDDFAQYYDTYGMSGSAILKLDASDYVEIYVTQTSGAGATMNYTTTVVYWSGELLG